MTSTVPGAFGGLAAYPLAVFKLLGKVEGRFVGHIAVQHIENEFLLNGRRMVYRWKACGGLSSEIGWICRATKQHQSGVLGSAGKGEVADIVRAGETFAVAPAVHPPSWWTSCLVRSSPARLAAWRR